MVGLIGSGGAGGSIDADEVIGIVDGSDVKVAEAVVADGAAAAEDADALGGQPPSSFETPSETQESDAVMSGWSRVTSNAGHQNWASVDKPADGVKVWSTSDTVSFEIEGATGDTIVSGDVHENDGTHTLSFDSQLVTTAYTNADNSSGAYVEIHVQGIPVHTHPL